MPTNQRLRSVVSIWSLKASPTTMIGSEPAITAQAKNQSRPVRCSRSASAAQPGAEQARDVLAQEEQGGEHRAALDDRREGGDVWVVGRVAEGALEDRQVPGARDRQELGESLDRAEQYRFPPFQAAELMGPP